MKEDGCLSFIHPRKAVIIRKVFTHPVVYVILLILCYLLGYFSHFESPAPPNQPPPQFPVQSIIQFSDLPTQLDNFRVTTHCGERIASQFVFPTILDKVFNGGSPYADFPPPHLRSLLKPNRIRGWGSYGAVFKNVIQRVKPRVIIEIGTFLGASALHMANLTRQLGLQTRIICVDDFRGWPGFRDRFKDVGMVNGDVLLLQQFMQNVVYFNATDLILPLPFSTASGLEKLCEWGIVADLIEIDAGHDFISAWGDINRAYRVLRPGGVLFGHDYFTAADNRGVRRAVNLFAQMNKFKIKTDGQHWVIDTA